MNRTSGILLSLLLLLLGPGSILYSFEYASSSSGNLDEGIYQLRYSKVVNRPIQVIVQKNEVFLPFTEILSYLKIYYRYDLSGKIIRGFFIKPDSIFVVDLESQKATYSKIVSNLRESDLIVSDLDIYVKNSFFKELFNININVFPEQLLVLVDEKIELPVLTEYKRRLLYNELNGYENDGFYQIKYDRKRSLINGAMLDYQLNGTSYKKNLSYGYGLNYGMEILGGDLQLNHYGYLNQSTGYATSNDDYRWRYYFSDNSYLTQFVAGSLNNTGYRQTTLPGQQIRGVQISNELTRIPNIFSNSTIIDKTDPGSQVELWVNGQLTDQTIADPSGNFQFNYPLNYGTSDISLRYYGTNGDYKEKRELYQIPTEFLRPGEIRYTLSGGEKLRTGEKIAEGRLFYGLTSWLTNSTSVSRDFTNNRVDYYNSLITRIGQSITTNFDYSNKLYKAKIRGWFNKFGNYDFSYTKYDGLSDLNYTGMMNSTVLFMTLPRILSLPVNFNVVANRMEYRSYYYNQADAGLNINIFPFYLETKFRYSTIDIKSGDQFSNQYLSFNAFYNWFTKPRFLSFLNNTRINVAVDYNLGSKNIERTNCSIDQKVFNFAILTMGISRDFINNYTFSNLGLKLELQQFRSESNTRELNNDAPVFTQMLQGSIGFDSDKLKVHFTNPIIHNTVGFGASSVRFFLDNNQNGTYDDGEEVIKGVKFEIPNASIEKGNSSDCKYAYNLIPYSMYNLIVDLGSFKNPLIIPASNKFAFIADPNTFKPIDVPCYASGIVEGTIYDGDKQEPFSTGIKIHIDAIEGNYHEVIPIYRDGTFYYMGVPPGDYLAYIDSLQLQSLGYISHPESQTFTIRRTTEGDYMENLNFVVNKINNLLGDRRLAYNTRIKQSFDGIVQPGDSIESIPPSQNSGKPANNKLNNNLLNINNIALPNEGSTKDITRKELLALLDNPVPNNINDLTPIDNAPISDNSIENQSDADNVKKVEKIAQFYYKTNKASILTTKVKNELDKFVDYLFEHPNTKLKIDGHSDNLGTIDESKMISEKRVNEIVGYMIQKGIQMNRLLSAGHGSLYPIADNSTSQGRSKNRRIEIKIID